MGLAPFGESDPNSLPAQRLYKGEGRLVFADEATVRDVIAASRSFVRKATRVRPGRSRALRAGCVRGVDAGLPRRAEQKGGSKNRSCGGCALNSSFNGKILGVAATRLCTFRPRRQTTVMRSAPRTRACEDPSRLDAARRPMSPYLGSRISGETWRALPNGSRAQTPRRRYRPETARLLRRASRRLGQGRASSARARSQSLASRDPGRQCQGHAHPREVARAVPAVRAVYPGEHGPDWFEDFRPRPTWIARYVRPEQRARVRRGSRRRHRPVADGDGEANPRFRALIEAFHALTGVPIVLNTSFNIMGKPILHSAEDALTMFYTTGLDAVVIEDWLLTK